MSHKNSLNCSACFFQFDSLKLLISHLKDLRLENEQTHCTSNYKCFYCVFECFGSEIYISHLENTHLIFQNNDSFPSSSTTNTAKVIFIEILIKFF